VNGDELGQATALVKSGLLAAFGGLVGHLVDNIKRGTKFSWVAFSVAVLVAFFVGQVLGDWLPHEMYGRDGVLMVAGTSGYPMLSALQDIVLRLVKKLGVGGQD
jgi:hypothetical protein